MHDVVKLQAILNETLINGRGLVQHETNLRTGSIDYAAYSNRELLYPYFSDMQYKETAIKSYITDEFDKGFFITRLQNINVKVDTFNIEITVTTKMEFPFYEIQRFFVNNNKPDSWINNTNTQSSVEFIRIFDVFSGVAEKNELVNKTLNKIRNIFNTLK
jgi:hypothetical protein